MSGQIDSAMELVSADCHTVLVTRLECGFVTGLYLVQLRNVGFHCRADHD